MKMAKASERDIEMALELSRTIEELMKGYFPYDGEETVMFDPQDHHDCHKAIDMLFEIACKGSLFRVVFGMAVVLDPRNEVVDPDSDVLELHPKHQKAIEQRDELLKAIEHIREYWNQDRNEAAMVDALEHILECSTEVIAKVEGRPHERPA